MALKADNNYLRVILLLKLRIYLPLGVLRVVDCPHLLAECLDC